MTEKDMTAEQQSAVKELKKTLKEYMEDDSKLPALEDMLWDTLIQFQGHPFYTAKNLEFFYLIKGNEMFVTRKDKSITKASIMMAFHRVLELRQIVTGPKKLGTFGASYLYPVFRYLEVIH